MVAAACSFAVERTNVPREAFGILERDGASILEWPDRSKDGVVDAAYAVFGDRILGHSAVMTFRPQTSAGTGRRLIRSSWTIFEATEADVDPEYGPVVGASPLTADGWANYPDLVALVCEREALSGGLNFIVDGYALLALLAATREGGMLVRELWSRGVPQRIHMVREYPPRVTPLARRTRGGRLSVMYAPQVVITPQEGEEDPYEVGNMLKEWSGVVEQAASKAPRFALKSGEVLLLDNYRVYWGRERYAGERVVHRCAFHTDTAYSYPLTDGSSNIEQLEQKVSNTAI